MYHFLILLFLLNTALAQQICGDVASHQLVGKLQKFGFQCQKMSTEGCDFHECEGLIAEYSQPIRIAIPAQTKNLRIHFHGHLLQIYPQYEKNLESMINAFGLRTRLCKSHETVVFPRSTGNGKNYDTELKEQVQIQNFMKALNALFDNALVDSPLHLSAHSGGGRVLSRFLNEKVGPNIVTLYDAIYSDSTEKSIAEWLKRSNGKFRSVTASGQGLKPFHYAENLRQSLNLKWNFSSALIQKATYQIYSNQQIEFLSTSYVDLKTHYQVVSDVWP